MYTNAGMDMERIRREAEAYKHSAIFDANEQLATAAARMTEHGAPNQCPDIVVAGSEEDLRDEFSFEDLGPDAAFARVRQARAYGNLRPAQILVDEDYQLLGPKARNEIELGAIAQGVFCWRCGDARLEDPAQRKDAHERLKQVFPNYEIPPGESVDTCCGTCGAILGLKQEVA